MNVNRIYVSGLMLYFIAFVLGCDSEPKKSAITDNVHYSTTKTWKELVERDDFRFSELIRISDPGSKENPAYTGFGFMMSFNLIQRIVICWE